MASMFTFLSVFWWALQRRREREAYYRYELARQLAARAAPETEQNAFLEWLRKQDEIEERRRRNGLMLGALVLIATGLGFLIAVDLRKDEAIMGWVPLFIGAAMLLHLGLTGRDE